MFNCRFVFCCRRLVTLMERKMLTHSSLFKDNTRSMKFYFRDLSIPAWPVFHNVTLVLKVVIYLLNIRIEEFLYWSCVERVPRRKKLYAMFEELVTRRKSISTVSRCLLSEQLVTQHLVIINYLLQINTMKCTFFCKFFEYWFYLTLILRKGNSCA